MLAVVVDVVQAREFCSSVFVTGKVHGRCSHTIGEGVNWLVQYGGPIDRFVVFLVGENGNGVVACPKPEVGCCWS